MALNGKKVLIIDDDEDIRILMRKIYEGAGLQVTEASTVQEGIDQINNNPPDFIILDLTIPDEDGFSFLEKRKGNQMMELIPVLVSSAATDSASVNKAIALGANNYIIKPLNSSKLLQKTRKLLLSADSKNVQYYFPKKEEVFLLVPTDIVQISEGEIVIQSSVRFSEEKAVILTAELLQRLEFKTSVFKSIQQKLPLIIDGSYQTTLKTLGTSEVNKDNIRRRIKSWNFEQ